MENNADSVSLQQSPQMRYMIQLDALRAIAVFGVLAFHFLPGNLFINYRLHVGPLGVRLFFVLSGFLITTILLRCRDLVRFNNQGVWFTVKQFYIRRCLRLMPVYYLAILIALIISSKSVKESLVWDLTYTSNIYFSFNDWVLVTSHFWSLSVEEQFYLFWALIILFLPEKLLLPTIISTIIIGPLFRLLLLKTGWGNGNGEYILTFSCFDSLGMGALLAYYSQVEKQFNQGKKYLIKVCFWIGIPLFVAINLTPLAGTYSSLLLVLGFTTASMFFVWLIDRAARGFNGFIGVLLEFQPFVYLGKISYGIYVYHLLVHAITEQLFIAFDSIILNSVWVKFFINTSLTIAIAALSWAIFEKPINKLKKHFEYEKVG